MLGSQAHQRYERARTDSRDSYTRYACPGNVPAQIA
jgi:hypothetical protein